MTGSRRVVVKVGSSSLTARDGGLDQDRLDQLVDALAEELARGGDVVLVSSGAIAAGLRPLGLAKRPRDLSTLQAAAAVGQSLLVERYAVAFGRHGKQVGQVLLTVDDVGRRTHYRNAQRTLDRLLQLGVVPIINENDTVATDEIRFGDNDRLAALVGHVVRADLLVLLSDVDGLYDGDPRSGGARLIREVRGADDLEGIVIGGVGSGVGTGGMTTKVEAARIATAAGVRVVLAAATDAAMALRVDTDTADREQLPGTVFHPTGRRGPTRLLWLAHASAPRGRLRLDAGATDAVLKRRLSLLPAGVVAVEGEFVAGDPVDLLDENGHTIARGLVNYDSAELPGLLGRSTRELADRLGPAYEREIVHRDDIVIVRH